MIEFEVRGIDPRPQGSKQAFSRGGRIVLVEMAGKPLRDWRSAVAEQARLVAPPTPLDGPVEVTMAFLLRRPKSTGRAMPHVRPDLDKLVRAVMDAITEARIWGDDSQACSIGAAKDYGPQPGVHVRVRPLP